MSNHRSTLKPNHVIKDVCAFIHVNILTLSISCLSFCTIVPHRENILQKLQSSLTTGWPVKHLLGFPPKDRCWPVLYDCTQWALVPTWHKKKVKYCKLFSDHKFTSNMAIQKYNTCSLRMTVCDCCHNSCLLNNQQKEKMHWSERPWWETFKRYSLSLIPGEIVLD